MKTYHVLVILVLLLCAPFASAEIVGWECTASDGITFWNPPAPELEGEEGMYSWLLDVYQDGYPGHLEGSLTTDTEADPTVWITEQIMNETGFTWTDYHIDIGMNKDFSIVGVVSPYDWTWDITSPVGGQQLPNQPTGTLGWVGTIDYFAGTPIADDEWDMFGFVVSFTGSVDFYTEQVPTGEPVAVPVPGAVLLGSVGLGVAGWKLRRKGL